MKNKISINLEVSLVEIIFSILIFAIAGAIMLNCFAAARFTQIKANDMVEAGNIIQTNAEMIKSFDDIREMDEYFNDNFSFKNLESNEKIYTNYYDNKWNSCDEQDKEYLVTVKINDISANSDNLKQIVIKAEKSAPYPFIDKNNKNNVIYEIETMKYFPSIEGRW